MATLRVAIEARGAAVGARQFDAATDKVRRSARSADRSVRGLDRSMRGLSGAGAGIGALAGAFAGFAGARQGIEIIGGFEESLVTLRGVSRATEAEFESLNETAQSLGITTRFSAREAADGLTFLARAGFTANEAVTAIPDTLNLAATSGLDLGRAADVASNVLRQFSLEADDTGRVVDTLTNVANNANTNVDQLAQALVFAGPQAGAFGQSVEQTAASLGVLGDAGIQATLAGTNLRGIISTLIDPTTEGKKALDSLGVSLEQVDPSAVSLSDIFKTLRDAGLGAAEATEIFGRRNVGAALILSESADRVEELTRLQVELRGETEKLADEFNDTLFGSLRNLRSAVEGLLISLDEEEGLGASLRTVIDFTTETIRVLAGVESSIKNATPAVLVAAGAVRVIAAALGVIVGFKIVTLVGSLAVGLGKAAVSAATLGGSLGTVAAALAAIGVAAAAFEFGRFLFDEFRVVQEVMAQIIAFVQRQLANVEFAVNASVIVIKGYVLDLLRDIQEPIEQYFRDLAEGLRAVEDLFGFSLGADAIDAFVDELNDAFNNFNVSDEILRERRELEEELERIEGVLKITLDNIEADFQDRDRRGGNFLDFVKRDVDEALAQLRTLRDEFFGSDQSTELNITADVTTAANEAERLTNALSVAERQSKKVADEAKKTEEETKKAAEAAEEFATFSGELIASSFEDAILAAESLQDILKGLLQDVARLTLRTFVTGPLGGFLGGLFNPTADAATNAIPSAMGNVIAGNSVKAFASGGVPRGMIDSSVIFPLRNGNIGVAGEAGTEYGAEPVRLPNGRLGVATTGGGNTVINMTVNTPDAASFQRSYRSIERRVARGAGRN